MSTGKASGQNESKEDGEKSPPMASVNELFLFFPSFPTKLIFGVGILTGVLNGLTYPFLAYLFSNTFSDLGSTAKDMTKIKELALQFVAIGAIGFLLGMIQSSCFEISAERAARNFRRAWFKALLRQDTAYFDIHDTSGIASTINANTKNVRRGLGRKFGEGVQFGITTVGGLAYAIYANWKITLVLPIILPVVSLSAIAAMKLNQKKTARAAASYETASGVVYSTVSSIRTVLSLNAVSEMIHQYTDATSKAYESGVSFLVYEGLTNGWMLGSFMCLYAILTLLGTYFIYGKVASTGCDPSGGIIGVETCPDNGPGIFGALLGAAFAGEGASHLGSVIGIVTTARVSMYPALEVMKRKVGSPPQKVIVPLEKLSNNVKNDKTDEIVTELHNLEEGATKKTLLLPEYKIDSSSIHGLKPLNVTGDITFKDVNFAYPARPDGEVFKDFNLNIKAGSTIALVGPSGGGKSTAVYLIERFYDPVSGTLSLDGIDLKQINVSYLRSLIGYVGQEPTLFATTIAANIKHGKPDATQEEIEAAARMANAHDFIMSFPDRYGTIVGDKGSQLSGGQKQRIAIARVMISNPKILLLDEATSALDSESELVVQDALDGILKESNRTTIIIAHRLSTIRNADVIAVISEGRVVEIGSHEELMKFETGHYRSLIEKENSNLAYSTDQSTSTNINKESTDDLPSQEEVVMGKSTNSCAKEFIEFKGVKFAYPTRPKNFVMNGLNLSIKRGETLALVGPSGGGKSTILSMLERFYDPNEGSIEYEGCSICDLNVSSMREIFGLVSQEPTLFNMTIRDNIRMGSTKATEEEIIDASKKANAYDFIKSFSHGFDTQVGERGVQLSGGQKQRIAIARAILKDPQVLLLDEATSALDTENESLVQEALDNISNSRAITTLIIAHRLSTIQNADRIAFVENGKVIELGSMNELMNIKNGRFRRLFDSQKRSSNVDIKTIIDSTTSGQKDIENKDDEIAVDDAELLEKAKKNFDAQYARKLALPDAKFFFIGLCGTILAAFVFPAWGIMFAQMMKLLFTPVLPCTDDGFIPGNHESCSAYYSTTAEHLKDFSYKLGIYWVVLVLVCIIGNIILYFGYGMASERLNKRVRDMVFTALVRQEVAFFDTQSVGNISSQLQDDVTELEAFLGDPIKSTTFALFSVVAGVMVSFLRMWPFALVTIGVIPFMGVASSLEMQYYMGSEDEKSDTTDDLNSPGGIVVEALLNIRTVAALNMEKICFNKYNESVNLFEPENNWTALKTGLTAGAAVLIQNWANALLFWWGGYLLINYPDKFTFEDFLMSMFALLFSLFGLGTAFADVKDKNKCIESAGRIFHLLNRQSQIDPLSKDGKMIQPREQQKDNHK